MRSSQYLSRTLFALTRRNPGYIVTIWIVAGGSRDAPVAQGTERRSPEPKVAGSNPARRASLIFFVGGYI